MILMLEAGRLLNKTSPWQQMLLSRYKIQLELQLDLQFNFDSKCKKYAVFYLIVAIVILN